MKTCQRLNWNSGFCDVQKSLDIEGRGGPWSLRVQSQQVFVALGSKFGKGQRVTNDSEGVLRLKRRYVLGIK